MGIICKVNNHKGIIEIFNKLKIKKKKLYLWIWCHPLEKNCCLHQILYSFMDLVSPIGDASLKYPLKLSIWQQKPCK